MEHDDTDGGGGEELWELRSWDHQRGSQNWRVLVVVAASVCLPSAIVAGVRPIPKRVSVMVDCSALTTGGNENNGAELRRVHKLCLTI